VDIDKGDTYGIDPLSKHIRALSDAVNKHFDDMYTSPRDRKVKAIAISICTARRLGPPNTLTVGGHPAVQTLAGNGAVAIVPPIQPAWVTFVAEADLALKAMESVDGY